MSALTQFTLTFGPGMSRSPYLSVWIGSLRSLFPIFLSARTRSSLWIGSAIPKRVHCGQCALRGQTTDTRGTYSEKSQFCSVFFFMNLSLHLSPLLWVLSNMKSAVARAAACWAGSRSWARRGHGQFGTSTDPRMPACVVRITSVHVRMHGCWWRPRK
jgi:hypothetical protein